MSKGYSREIMEELFREEQKKQEEEKLAKQQRQKQQSEQAKLEIIYGQLLNTQEELQQLSKKVRILKYVTVAAIALAVIAIAISANASLQDLLLTMP